jgi:atypical dual specificity phosphatase
MPIPCDKGRDSTSSNGLTIRWILPGILAGASMPGLRRPLGDDLAELASQGVKLLVTLTENSLAVDGSEYGLRCLHFPIADMGTTTPRRAAALCEEVERSLERGEAVALHCRAGLGRTGMMLACCLVAKGLDAEEAISKVRRVCSHHIQTRSQELLVHHFAEFRTGESAALPRLKLPENVRGGTIGS